MRFKYESKSMFQTQKRDPTCTFRKTSHRLRSIIIKFLSDSSYHPNERRGRKGASCGKINKSMWTMTLHVCVKKGQKCKEARDYLCRDQFRIQSCDTGTIDMSAHSPIEITLNFILGTLNSSLFNYSQVKRDLEKTMAP